MKKQLLAVGLLFALVVLALPASAQIKIDGLFFDWPSKTQIDVAPNAPSLLFSEGGETNPPRGSTNPNYFIDMDLSHIYAADDADFVYVRIKMNPGANVANILTDTSYHGGGAITVYISVDPGAKDTTGLTWGWWGSGYDYFIQAFPEDTAAKKFIGYPQYIWEHKQTGSGWDFEVQDSARGARVAWNAANNEVEMEIPKAFLFHPKNLKNFVQPDSIAIMVYAGENFSPWRADYACNAGIKGYMVGIKKPGKVKIDGLFFDWNNAWQIDKAPNATKLLFSEGGETNPPRGSTDPNYFVDMNIWHSYATSDDDYIYFRVNMNPAANVTNILTDTSYHGGGAITAYISLDPGSKDTTGLTWGWWGSGYDMYVGLYPDDTVMKKKTGFQQPIYEHKQNGSGWDYEVMDSVRGAWVSWNAANNQCEVAIPKILLLHPKNMTLAKTPDSIAVMLYAGENWSPWRADYACNAGVKGYMVATGVLTAVEPAPSRLPDDYRLEQNYPNPFNPSTKISYALPSAGMVTLKVYNLLGQEVATLVNGFQAAGAHQTVFNASKLTSGVYFYHITSGSFQQTRKMLLLK